MPDPGAIASNIFSAFQAGQQARQQTEYKNALGGYAMNPSEQGLAALAPHNPEFVMAERQRMAQASAAQQKQQQDQLPIIGRLLEQAVDEPSYQQARQMAQRYGLDVSEIPPNFDPNWVGQTKALVAAVQSTTGTEALSSAGKIAADMGYKPGTPEHAQATREIFLADAAKPYTGAQGETRLYIPQLTNSGQPLPPKPGTIVGGFVYKGGDPKDRNSYEPAGQSEGGAGASRIGSNFLDGL